MNAFGGRMNRIHDLKKDEAHHILVWMPNWIGDVVFSLPTIQALRTQFPQSRITAVVQPPANEILSHHPDIDSVIKSPFNKKDGLWAQMRFARSLRKYRFDVAVLFPNSMRSAFLAYWSGSITGSEVRMFPGPKMATNGVPTMAPRFMIPLSLATSN